MCAEKAQIKVVRGLAQKMRGQATKIYYEAFKLKIDKLLLVPTSKEQALRIIEKSTNFDNGLFALYKEEVVGVLGMNYRDKRYLHYNLVDLHQEFGVLGALWRLAILRIEDMQIKLKPSEIRIEAVAVAAKMRGLGVGKLLFAKIFRMAKENSFSSARLEVINTNKQAHSLYKRLGFQDVKESKYGLFTTHAGFSSIFSMKKELDSVASEEV